MPSRLVSLFLVTTRSKCRGLGRRSPPFPAPLTHLVFVHLSQPNWSLYRVRMDTFTPLGNDAFVRILCHEITGTKHTSVKVKLSLYLTKYHFTSRDSCW